jgi:hypothetical protein
LKFVCAGQTKTYSFQGPLAECENKCTFSVTVEKCKYCVAERESTHTLAAKFGRHWTQIWSSNPHLLSPDTLSVQQLISLGNSYRLQYGDTWTSVSVRFGVSIALLQQLNPDFQDEDGFVHSAKLYKHTLDHNATMCIMPETCPGYRPVVPGISW